MIQKIRVLNVDYEIEEKETVVIGNEIKFGLCNSSESRIEICSDMDDRRRREVLMHEIMHAIEYEYSISLDERQVDVLANGILKTFDENNLMAEFYPTTQLVIHAKEAVAFDEPDKSSMELETRCCAICGVTNVFLYISHLPNNNEIWLCQNHYERYNRLFAGRTTDLRRSVSILLNEINEWMDKIRKTLEENCAREADK